MREIPCLTRGLRRRHDHKGITINGTGTLAVILAANVNGGS